MIEYNRHLIVQDSVIVEDIFYDSFRTTMHVAFADGTMYRYDDVDHAVFGHLAGAPSIGKALNELASFNSGFKVQQTED